MVRTGSKADQDLEEMAPLSIRSSMDYFHTLLYGMMPLHLIKSVQEIIKKKDSGFPLSSCLDFKEDNESGPLFPGFEQWVDPILSERLDKARLAVPDGTISIAESLKERLTRHKLHPALLSMTLEEELVEPWFKDMDASDLTVECMLLRSLPVSPVHETPTDELPLVAGKKQDEDGEGRDPLVENVMQTYLLLCHLDPYLKVKIYARLFPSCN